MRVNIGFYFIFAAFFISCNSCKHKLEYHQGDIDIEILTGDNWIHDYPLLLGLKIKNPPQFAVWAEDTAGNYLYSLFVTKKIATEGWVSNNGNRRKEALPHWSFKRGIIYDDGLMLPTKNNPLADGITGETPKKDKTIIARFKNFQSPIVLKAEFNHSTDFNEHFPKTAIQNDSNYSGGEGGSGQPGIVYADTIFPYQQNGTLKYIGCSSSDGSNGELFNDWEKLTSAKKIIKQINFKIIQ